MIGSLVILAVLLACSGILSSSETVLFGLTRHELYRCQHSKRPLRRLAAELMHRPRRILLTILIGNTTVNVLIFASSYVISEQLAGRSKLLASLWGVITVILVIVIGEVLAKNLAISMRYSAAPLVAPVVRVLEVLFSPIRIVCDTLLVTPLTRLLAGRAATVASNLVTVEELQGLVQVGRDTGVIAPSERDMLQEVIALASTRVRSIMLPRVDIVALDRRFGRQAAVERLRKGGLTKLPIFEGDIDHIVGMVHIKDLHLKPKATLRALIRPVRFVPELMTVDQLLEHFRESATQLAIVVDEYGGVAGLVTLEDVVEQIVGDIAESGEDVQPVQRIDTRTCLVSGALSIPAWVALFGPILASGRVTTVGGLVASQLGRLPAVGDVIRVGRHTVTVEAMVHQRVRRVRVVDEDIAE